MSESEGVVMRVMALLVERLKIDIFRYVFLIDVLRLSSTLSVSSGFRVGLPMLMF